jgi:hypothetical protein
MSGWFSAVGGIAFRFGAFPVLFGAYLGCHEFEDGVGCRFLRIVRECMVLSRVHLCQEVTFEHILWSAGDSTIGASRSK